MSASATLQFLGAAGTVTGSKHLVETPSGRLLLDCGLFQGLKELRLRNWAEPPFVPQSLDAVVLSHAHIDHCGYLPLIVRRGFRGKVYCTPATQALLGIVLIDSARLQEEDAEYANRKGFSKHHPAQPLYSVRDAERTLKLIEGRPYHDPFPVIDGAMAVFRRTGHIFGSASVELQLQEPHPCRLVYSGDLGRWERPILRDPEHVPAADVLLVESTYGNRNHPRGSVNEALAKVIRAAVQRGGAIIIPAFAVGRTQELIWRLRELHDRKVIPSLPVFVDSPMATDVTELFCQHPEEHDLEMGLLKDKQRCPFCSGSCQFIRTPEESRALNDRHDSFILIASSGMATGGRVVHHLKQRLPDPKTTVILIGYQARGTRGHTLQQGTRFLRMHGRDIPVKANVVTLDGLSAHADRDEILKWLSGFHQPPRQVYVVHGEPEAAKALADAIQLELGWSAHVARDRERVTLTA